MIGGHNDHPRSPPILEGERTGVEVVYFPLRGTGPGRITSHPDRLRRGDGDPGDTSLPFQPLRLGARRDHKQDQQK